MNGKVIYIFPYWDDIGTEDSGSAEQDNSDATKEE